MKKFFFILIRILVSFSLLGLLFWVMRHDIRTISIILSKANPRIITLSILLILLNTNMLAQRLKIIFKGENLDISMLQALQLTYIGYYFNNFMPTAIGGDIFKAHCAAGFNKKRIQSYTSVLVDRLIGLYTFVVIASFAFIIDGGIYRMPLIKFAIFMSLFFGIVIMFLIANKRVKAGAAIFFTRLKFFRIGKHLNSALCIVHDYKNRVDVVIKAFLISIIGQCMYFVVVYLFFLSLGTIVPIGNVFLIMPIVIFLSMLPSLGGLGVREGAIVIFFTPLAGKEAAFAVSLLVLFGYLFISIIGGIVYFWRNIRCTPNFNLVKS